MFRQPAFALLLCAALTPLAPAQQTWTFAVSGDSRNCGDIVMPVIAAGARHDQAAFYWHLGDLRAIYTFDQDLQQLATAGGAPLLIIDYENRAWDDFIENQIGPFGNLPFFLGIGNHETIPQDPTGIHHSVCRLARYSRTPKAVPEGQPQRPPLAHLLSLAAQ